MYLIYCLVAVLSYFWFITNYEIAEKEKKFASINKSLGMAWFGITGLILPVIVLFYNLKWYMAIIYFIGIVLVMTFLSKLLIGIYNSFFPPTFTRIDFRPTIVLSLLSIILFLIIAFR